MRSLLPLPFSSWRRAALLCVHACRRSMRGAPGWPSRWPATATLATSMPSFLLRTWPARSYLSDCRQRKARARASRQALPPGPPAQSSAIISHRRRSRWGQSLLRHGQPSQHGGLIPLLRLLFLRLIPPGFLLTSQTIILLALGQQGKQPTAHTVLPGPSCRQHASRLPTSVLRPAGPSWNHSVPAAPASGRPTAQIHTASGHGARRSHRGSRGGIR